MTQPRQDPSNHMTRFAGPQNQRPNANHRNYFRQMEKDSSSQGKMSIAERRSFSTSGDCTHIKSHDVRTH